LPESAEVAAYYVVAEALTNTAKHAHASQFNVRVDTGGANLYVSIRDDGIGGTDPTKGSDYAASSTASKPSRWCPNSGVKVVDVGSARACNCDPM
jgi:anti-sigma regulatory factor (Ser/Thr protein kinase)